MLRPVGRKLTLEERQQILKDNELINKTVQARRTASMPFRSKVKSEYKLVFKRIKYRRTVKP